MTTQTLKEQPFEMELKKSKEAFLKLMMIVGLAKAANSFEAREGKISEHLKRGVEEQIEAGIREYNEMFRRLSIPHKLKEVTQ